VATSALTILTFGLFGMKLFWRTNYKKSNCTKYKFFEILKININKRQLNLVTTYILGYYAP